MLAFCGACFQVSGPIDPAVVASDLADSGTFASNVAASAPVTAAVAAAVQQSVAGQADAGVAAFGAALATRYPADGGTIGGSATIIGDLDVQGITTLGQTQATSLGATSLTVGMAGALSMGPVQLAPRSADSLKGTSAIASFGVVCGYDHTTYNGSQVGGFTGAIAKCTAACGAPAHLCTTAEYMSSLSAGFDPSGGAYGAWLVGMSNCAGFTSSSSSEIGTAIGLVGSSGTAGFPFDPNGRAPCQSSYPLMCCR